MPTTRTHRCARIGTAICITIAFQTGHAQTYSRTDTVTYADHLSLWVVGQTATTTNVETGVIESRTDYDPATALPVAIYGPGTSSAPGKLLQRLTYDLASAVSTGQRGVLQSISDGRDTGTYNTTITLSNWKRGIPQLVSFPDGTSKSAVVDDLGQILSVTDENNAQTCYAYDPMGRVSQVTYPNETTVTSGIHDCGTDKWQITTRTFAPVNGSEYGISAGHWTDTVETGNSRRVTYYDALWRPLVSEAYDTTNWTGTRTLAVTRYDADGRVIFKGYPTSTLSDYSAVTPGIRSAYDALGRPTRVEQDSERGLLVTTTAYNTGFTTEVTNPRGNVTLTSYLTYDQPSTDWPLSIQQPEGVVIGISRDTFGNPTLLRKRNADSTYYSTRYYTYDAALRLCKTIDPEAGATVFDYDLAGNLAWSAAGLALGDTTNASCTPDRSSAFASGRRVDREYDQRNRLLSLEFPDGLGDQVWTYTPDGLPATINTTNTGGIQVANGYSYNFRRLLTGESMVQPGASWSLGYGYNSLGNQSISLTQPGGEVINFAPNALGQPTQAVSSYANYATGVTYYPNGAMWQFTYGNGIVHTLTQNDRQLPARSQDSFNGTPVLDDSYAYDNNGNVTAITDALVGNRGSRTLAYDDLDRLTSATSPMFGGTVSYTYDVLDNIQTLSAPGRSLRYCYDAGFRLAFVRSNSTDCNNGAATTALSYDLQGNLASKNGQAYSFDYGNRLRVVTGLESYLYDGNGRRVSATLTATGKPIYSIYGQDGVLRYQRDNRKNRVYNYVYLNGSLVGTRETDAASGVSSIKYQHTDALGTPVAVTDASRNVIERSEYEPYGKVLNRPIHDGPGYTGHVEDAATGLTYMQQRYYDPAIGRFLSVDPVTANPRTGGNFNRYWYANNNPYRFIDPDGRVVVIVGDKMKELVEKAKKESPIAAAQLKTLESSNKTHTIQQETRLNQQSNANNTGNGAFLRADGKPGVGSGSVVAVKLSTEKVQMAKEPGGKVSIVAVSNQEKLVHELAHALQMDSGTLREPAGPNEMENRAVNEDGAKDVEDAYRQEQGLEGRRQWVSP